MLTIEELTIIRMYCSFLPDRDEVVSALREALPFIEDPDIQETVNSTMVKVNAMKQEEFEKLDLSQAMDPTEIED